MSDIGLELPSQAVAASQVLNEKEYEEQYHYLSMEALEEDTRKQLQEFVEKLEIKTPMDVQNFGVNTQRELSVISDSILKSTRTRDTGPISKDITELILVLNNYDVKVKELQQEKDNIFEKLLSGFKSRTLKIQTEYSSVAANIDRVVNVLENHMIELRQSLATMEKLFESNDKYITQLKHYIIAGKVKLEELQAKRLPELEQRANTSGDPQQIQQVSDFREVIYKFDKKIHNLLVSRMLSIQMAAEIRMIQKVDTQILENISDQLMLAIPMWKTQMVVAIAVNEAADADKSSELIANSINKSMTQTAEMLKDTSLKVAAAAERSVIDESTIQSINRNLVDTISGVYEISKRAQQERADKEKRLQSYETELKNVLVIK
jgi:uncharacterized protein YaaN involved in tellurite resistance